jgi:hypothetical protein
VVLLKSTIIKFIIFQLLHPPVTSSFLMRGSLFQITSFIVPTATRAEKPELPLRLDEAFPIHM